MSSNDVFGYLFLGIALAFTVGIIVISVRYAKNRARELAKVAQGIGFRFVGNDWSNASRSPQFKTPLFQRTRGRFRNVMTGSADRFQTSLFDYAYTMGKSSVTQTVAAFSTGSETPSSTTTLTSIHTRDSPDDISCKAPNKRALGNS
jgi:hypothetical protein